MKRKIEHHLKHYFIPHPGNNFKPHILHTKRMIFYSLVFLLLKGIIVLFAILVPAQAYMLPDVLFPQYQKLIVLTNALRVGKGLPSLAPSALLDYSADAKALDMAQGQYFSHVGPNNHTLSYFLKKAGYKYRVAGENLAMGFSDADTVMEAWKQSPTHFASLVDTDFKEIGVGLEAGFYNNEPTIYAVEHFGASTPAAELDSRPTLVSQDAPNRSKFVANKNTLVEGEKIVNNNFSSQEETIIDESRSRVFWIEEGNRTRLEARVIISGSPVRSVVSIGNYKINLSSSANKNEYIGSAVVNQKAETFFDPVILPTIVIITPDGKTVNEFVAWYNIKSVARGPLESYLQAKKLLSPITNIFSVSKNIFAAFAVFFAIALFINIAFQVRKHQYHIILQTVLMLVLLVGLWWV